MADTERTLAALQTLFADNSASAISEQDLRDFLVTSMGGYAGIKVSAGTGTQALTDTPSKVTQFDAVGPSRGVTPSASDDSLTIGVTGHYLVEANLSFTLSATDRLLVTIRQGATPIFGGRVYTTTGEEAHVSFGGPVSLDVDDVITVYAATATAGGGNLVLKDGQLNVKRIGGA